MIEDDDTKELEPVAIEPEEPEDDDAPVIVTLGDEVPADEEDEADVPEEAPSWAKKLREVSEDRRRENRELKKRLAEVEAKAAPVEAEPELGKEPDLEDFDYDTDAFKTAWRKWDADAKAIETRKAAKQREAEQAQEVWQSRVATYEDGKKKLRVPDYEDVAEVVLSKFDQTQHGIMVHAAKDPALLEYAIGKDPKAAAELAAIKDPIAFTWALSKLEDKIKVTSRKPSTRPEGAIKTSGKAGSALDNHLDRLRDEAERTGDYSKVMAYKRQLASK